MTGDAYAGRAASSGGGRLPYALIASLWLAEMTCSFETAMILATLKVLIAQFGDAAKVGWLVTGFLIVGAAVAALVGRLGDIFGRRRVLVIVLFCAAAGSLLSAASNSYALLLTGRIIQGVTGAILPLCIGLVRENLPEERVPAGIGLMISGSSIGTAGGLVIGGLIVDHFSWHGVFLASAGFSLASILALMLFVPVSKRHPAKPSWHWLGGLVFAPAVTLVLLYLNTGKAWGWLSPAALGTLGAGILLLLWWARQSLRSPEPLIAVRSLADRTVAVGSLVTAFVAMGALQITVFFSLLLQAPRWSVMGLGLTATAAGLAKLPSNLTSVLAGPLGGWLAGRGGGRRAMVLGGLLTTLGWSLALFDTSSTQIVIGELIVISFGTTMLFAVSPTIIAQASPPERISEILGVVAVIRQLFMGVGAQLVTTLLASDSIARGTERYPSPYAYQLTLWTIIGLCMAAVLVSLALPGGKARREAPAPASSPQAG